MNVHVEFLRAKAAPAALSAAIALVFGISASAQAQYTYPGRASSSGHSATISPMRAGARQHADYGRTPARSTKPSESSPDSGSCDVPGPNCNAGGGERDGGGPSSSGPVGYGGDTSGHANSIHPIRAGTRMHANAQATTGTGSGNPSMRRGEACPPGTTCAGPVPAHGNENPGQLSGGYGAHESYGYGATPARQSGSGKASISPVQAGHGALNYGPSQTSNANFRNSVTGKTSGPNVNTTGQPTSFTGPNGSKVNMSSSQTFTGPNGQRQTIGGGPDLNNLGGGYGQQKGSGIKQGVNYSADGNGSISGTRTGSAPGMASASGMNMNNGGVSGAETGDRTNPNFQKGQSKDGGVAVYDGPLSNSLYNHTGGDGEPHDGHPDNGIDRNGTEWKGGKVWDGTDSNGVKWRNGVQSSPGKMTNTSVADTGATAGPGEIVSGTGQVVHPGQKKGQDSGGGQGKDGGSTSGGGRNAQGQYIAPSGQDNIKKPKEVGTLKMDYNGKNGAIDPKLNGSNGGGG